MGNGPLLIGTNQGEAQIFGNGGTVQLFGQLLARQQAKREREQQLLANQLSQVKPDGLRNEADKKEFFTQYQDLKDMATKINYEKDAWKRAQMKANVDQRILELNDYSNRSKKQAATEDFLAKDMFTNRDRYDDEGVNSLQLSKQLPLGSQGLITDPTQVHRRVDADKIDKLITTGEKALLSKTQFGNPIQKAAKVGNKTGVYTYNQREVDPVEQMHYYGNLYSADPNFRQYMKQNYGDLYANNDEQTAKALAIKDFADQRRATGLLSESTQPKFEENYVNHHAENRLFDIAHPLPTKTGEVAVGATPSDVNISYGSADKQKGIPQPNVNVKGFVPISIPAKNFGGSAAYNLTDGTKNEVLQPSDNYSIVGVGNYPFINSHVKDSKGQDMYGTVAQPDYAKKNPSSVSYKPMVHVKSKGTADEGDVDHLIDYSKIPENIKSSKAVKSALSNFQPAGGEPVQVTPKVAKVTGNEVHYNGKKYNMDAVKKAADASGMSVKDYLKAITK